MGEGIFPSKGGEYEIDMSSGRIMPKMLLFAVPLAFSGMFQLLFNTADVIVVGRFAGDNSLAAVGSNGSLISLLTNIFIGLSIGTNVLVSRYYGAGDEDDLSRTVHTSMLVGVAAGLLLMVGGMSAARRILVLMRVPEKVLPLSTLYLVIYFLSIPAMMVYNFGSAVLRAVGDTRRPLFYLIAAGVINVLLNLFFVVNMRLDVAGVALATVISQFISAVLVVRCLMREKSAIRLIPSKLAVSREKLFLIMRIGIPAGLQGAVLSLSNVVVQSTLNTFGAAVMAGNSISWNLGMYIYIAQNAFSQAMLSFTSQNYGAGRVGRISRVLRRGLICTLVAGGILSVLCIIFARELLGIFSSSEEVVKAGMPLIIILCGTYPLCGVMEGIAGVVRGLSFSVLPTVITLFGSCVLRIAWIEAVFRVEALRTASGVYISYPVSWIITSAVHYLCYKWIMKNKVLPEARAAVLKYGHTAGQ